MTSFIPTVLCCFASLLISDGLSNSLLESPCGDWTPHKNEKCIKLATQAGLQTKDDGKIVCNALAEEFHDNIVPKLVTVKTQEKQQFLQKWIFEELEDLDNVWLGLELGTDDVFRWNDGSELSFTNWDEETTIDKERRCVQMESGEGTLERGKWVRANCKKRNSVVCERMQPWSIAALQDAFLNLELKVTRNKDESEQKLNDAKKEAEQKVNEAKKEAEQKIDAANQEIANLKQNPVPIGFVYVQLPGKDLPTTLWPQTSWKDVGSQYAGLFFRVEGGDAAPFGQLQEDNTRRFLRMASYYSNENEDTDLPTDGSVSKYVWTGTNATGTRIALGVQLTTGEVRPRNKSVKIWQRIK